MIRTLSLLVFLLASLFPIISLAHPNHSPIAGFTDGFLHPLIGVDHLLAMIAVGILAFQKKKRWIWGLPLTFIIFMVVGGILGVKGITFPWFELGISLSVLTFGFCIAFPQFISSVALTSLVMVFALCHGYAHGIEMLPVQSVKFYGLGFVITTALLHIFGILIGKLLYQSPRILKYSGLGMALSVFWL